MMTENTADQATEVGQPVVTPVTSYDTRTPIFLMPGNTYQARQHLLTTSNVTSPILYSADRKKGASAKQVMTEKTLLSNKDYLDSFVNLTSSADGADEEESPMTETEISEPKTGTTTASYGTGTSSPASATQIQPASCLQRGSSFHDDEKRQSAMTDREIRRAYSSLKDAFLVNHLENVNGFVIIDTQDPYDYQLKSENERETSPKRANTGAFSRLAASAPEFRPLPLRNAETDRILQTVLPKEPLTKARSNRVYNPLAVEWCPNHRRKNIGFEEGAHIRYGRPELTVAVGRSPQFHSLEQTISIQMMGEEEDGHDLNFSEGQSDFMTANWVETPASTSMICDIASDGQNRKIGEQSQNIDCATQQSLATLRRIQLHYKPTLAQRRAERQLANAQIGPSQPASTTARDPPTPLLMSQEPGKFNTAAPVWSSPTSTSVFQQGQHRVISRNQNLTWKRLPKPDPKHSTSHPEFAKWIKVEQDLLRMGLIKRFPGKPDGGSFVVPKNFEQWLEFRAGQNKDLLLQQAAKSHGMITEDEAARRHHQSSAMKKARVSVLGAPESTRNIRIGPAMEGKEFHDGRGTVLAHPSTWSPWYKPTQERPEALWPCAEEMKEEGDERHTSAFGRFLALPRVPGNPTVVWKVKPVVPALSFDEVWKVPDKHTWADVHNRTTDDDDDDAQYMKALVGQALLEAIDS